MKYLTYFQLRNLWIEFWKGKDHKKFDSFSLVSNDQSLLWINSGVAGLKDYFLGIKLSENPRIVNIQKSVRTNDFIEIGKTNRHLSFFEMLGNFSIGDYFKKESLIWAIEFLTDLKWLGIDKKKIYITYFKDDFESFEIFIKLGIDKTHLFPMSRKTNFWDLGVGPCGPNLELFYDLGKKYDLKNKGAELIKKNIENDRYLEIWNIVFSEFINLGNNKYKKLKTKNIDTGAGLERILMISQKKETPFETDLFDTSLKILEKILDIKINISDKKEKEFMKRIKIILDHSRSITFLISDLLSLNIDINFKNKRGYVLRKIIRNACLQFYFLNIKKPIIYLLIDSICEKYSVVYKNLSKFKNEIKKIVKKEEILFFNLLKNKIILDLLKSKNKKFSGKFIFNLVTIFGVPIEIIKNISNNNNIELDLINFKKFWKEHQKISKQKDRKFIEEWKTFYVDSEPTIFYENISRMSSKILDIFEEQKKETKTNKIVWIIFDKTPFYAEKGGQTFDTGEIIKNNIISKVIDVQINNKKQILHKIVLKTNIKVGDNIILKICETKRNLTRKNHSSTHLLHSLLRSQISMKIKQNGSFNNEEYLRLDFYSDVKINKNQIIEVEKKINEIIKMEIDSEIFYTSLNESKKIGVVSFFENFYDKKKVRVVKFKNYSIELCGGTHVKNTRDIESFRIIDFKTISSNIYRIYAKTTNKKKSELNLKYQKLLSDLVFKMKEKINFLNYNKINKTIELLKEEPKSFINTKENLEKLKELIINIFDKNYKKILLNIVKDYKIPELDIRYKKNIKIITHILTINLKNKKNFLIVLFDYLKKEENIVICLLDKIKPNFNSVLFINKTKNKNINWTNELKLFFKKNISGGGTEQKFRGLIKNIDPKKLFDFILNKI